MGVQELWRSCIPGVKAKPSQPFETASNQRIAVDISCTLHACMSRPKIALLTCCVPSYVPNEIIQMLESNHLSFTKHNITPHYVFDGCEHPLKADAIAGRIEDRNRARASQCI